MLRGIECLHDSIKYILPVYTNSQTGNSMEDRFDKEFDVNDVYNNVMYESTESRYATEIVNASNIGAGANFSAPNGVVVTFKDGAFGTKGEAYIDGSAVFYVVVDGVRKPLAIQDATGAWFTGSEIPVGTNGTDVTYMRAKTHVVGANADGARTVTFSLETKDGVDGVYADVADASAYTFAAVGRYDSERDLIGQNLGEVELVMKDYHFRPRPISLGVTWTQLTDLVLDTSFGVSAEETLMDAAAQEIKKTLDYQSVKFAASMQEIRAKDNFVVFDANAGDTTDDSYKLTAQLITNAINRIADRQLNAIGRGGVTALVGGPAAVNYLTLHDQFTTRGAQPAVGGHQVGEVMGIPVFKVPSSVLPETDLITTWKNDRQESDVSVAIGTLLAFWTSGTIQRKNLYKEAAIARFEDTQCLNPLYLGRVRINNMRYM